MKFIVLHVHTFQHVYSLERIHTVAWNIKLLHNISSMAHCQVPIRVSFPTIKGITPNQPRCFDTDVLHMQNSSLVQNHKQPPQNEVYVIILLSFLNVSLSYSTIF